MSGATRDPAPLARTLIVVLWIFIAAEGLLFLSRLLLFGALGRAEADMDASLYMEAYGGAAEAWAALAGIFYLLVYVLTAFFTLKWIYRVNLNARSMAPDKQVSAGWAVGWYFIPFASLFMPFKAMRETWQISHSPQTWREVPVPSLLRWWWGLFLTASIVGNLASQLDSAARTVGDVALGNLLVMLSMPFGGALCLVLMRVVRRISEAQTARLQMDPAPEMAALGTVSG